MPPHVAYVGGSPQSPMLFDEHGSFVGQPVGIAFGSQSCAPVVHDERHSEAIFPLSCVMQQTLPSVQLAVELHVRLVGGCCVPACGVHVPGAPHVDEKPLFACVTQHT